MITSAKINIEKVIETEIPPLPHSISLVLELTQDENCSARDIANAIGTDPALAAKALRIANSPIYYLEREITTLLMAVNTLGNEAIKALLMTSFFSDSVGKFLQKSPQAIKLWSHSIAVGLTARELSAELGMRSREEAFVCGLLHDLGKLALFCYDPQFYQHTTGISDENEVIQSELLHYGYSHTQVGAIMAKRWRLPKAIADTIYYHHQPGEAGEAVFMARIIDVADQIANLEGHGLRIIPKERDISLSESAIYLQLEKEQLNAVWEKAAKSLETSLEKLGKL